MQLGTICPCNSPLHNLGTFSALCCAGRAPLQHRLPPLGGATPQPLRRVLLQTLANHIAAMVLLATGRVFTQAELLGVYAGRPAPALVTWHCLPSQDQKGRKSLSRQSRLACVQEGHLLLGLPWEAAPASTYQTATIAQCAPAVCKALAGA